MPTLLYVFAFASGFAALGYQVAWTRMLSMSFGSSTLAASAVVAGFMGGMGLGAWLYHRVGDRLASALRAYALLELGIAFSTALATLLFLRLPPVLAALASTAPGFVDAPIVRVVSVAMLLGLPAVLMGATYPALCRVLIHSADEVERRLGWIYGINTLGGAAGSMVAGFAMIELIGSRGTVLLSNALNLIVALGAFALVGRETRGTRAPDPSEVDERLPGGLPDWLAGLVLFGSGLATLGFEIVWLRALHYVLGAGTYVLSATLSIFLVGLGLGGLLSRTLLRLGRPEWSLGWGQLAVALFTILAIAAEHRILTSPALFDRISAFSRDALALPWLVSLVTAVGVVIALVLPATIWMGLAFPLASRLFVRRVDHLTARAGLAYLLSNLGSIAGAIGAAVFVLPTLGSVGGTKLFVAVNVVLGLLVLLHGGDRRVRIGAVVASLALLALAARLPERLAFSPLVARENPRAVTRLFEEESDLGTVQVHAWQGRPDALAMSIDGVVIGCSAGWSPGLHSKQLILAHLPMSLDRDIRHTLNLGVASASTLRTLARYPWVETLDAVEINPAVLRGTAHFPDAVVLEDPRTRIYVEDAVHHLLRTTTRYDLVINDAKQNVKFGGSSKVLSEEIYRYSLERMSECGLFAQFIPTLYPNESLRLILRTFAAVFPETEIFLDAPSAIMLVGSRCPIGGRTRPTREALEAARAPREIEDVFVSDATALPALWVSSAAELAGAIGPGPRNDWNRLLLEFWSMRMPPISPRTIAASMRLVQPVRAEDAPPPWLDDVREEWQTIQLINEAMIRVNEGDPAGAEAIAEAAQARDPDHPLLRRVLR
ncbi:MAG TPA: fused MFS/spermidine synthase [Myxococcota bacterium]|nr:fused MFS/spermidine synthase [Myxococcota bacterium]